MTKNALRGTGTGPGISTVRVPVEPARKPGVDYPDGLLPLFAPGAIDTVSDYHRRDVRQTAAADRLARAANEVMASVPPRKKKG